MKTVISASQNNDNTKSVPREKTLQFDALGPKEKENSLIQLNCKIGSKTVKLVRDKPKLELERLVRFNAQLFLEFFPEDLIFCPEFNYLLIWNGPYWQKDAEDVLVGWAKEFFREFPNLVLGDPDIIKKWHHSSRIKPNRTKMIRYLRHLVKHLSASEFDAKPMLNNHDCGTFDREAGEMRSHRRNDFFTEVIPENS